MELHKKNDQKSLYTEVESHDNILTRTGKLVNPKCFYGENIAFQFCPSMRPIIKFVVISMASYFDFYYDSSWKFVKVLCFSNSFAKYLLRPNQRAAQYIHACENSSTKFCRVIFLFLIVSIAWQSEWVYLQSFWFLNEGRLAHSVPSILGYKVEVNKVFKILSEPFEIFSENLNKAVEIPQPISHIGLAPISCRLLSARRRKGMVKKCISKHWNSSNNINF